MKVSTSTRANIAALTKKGLSRGRIAQVVGLSRSTVAYHMQGAGYYAAKRQVAPNNSTCRRAFSPEEDQFILAEAGAGRAPIEIGRLCKKFGKPRRRSSIVGRLTLLELLTKQAAPTMNAAPASP